MTDKNHPSIIVIKRVKKKQPHHGGAWKIAYADFVTAMMAFFMLMWLLSMLNKYQLQGISNYFKKPLKEVYVENQKNDTKTPKQPDEQTKKYPLAPSQSKPDTTKTNNSLDNLKKLKQQLEQSLQANPDISAHKNQLSFELMDDGLKVQLGDLENKPMFSLGESDFQNYAQKIITWLSKELNTSPQKITIIGYTDSRAYAKPANYSNWELSTERANATRRLLVVHGLDPNKIIRIQGAGDVKLLDKKTGKNPINRRIEIIILTDDAAARLLKQ